MEEKNTGVFQNALIWGIILGLVSIIYSVILYVLDESLNRTLGLASIVITFAVLYFGTMNFRDSIREGVLPFSTAFSFGILAVVIASAISAIYTYLQFTVIDPGLMDKVAEMTMEQMLDRGVPEDQLDTAIEMAMKFTSPIVMSVTGFFMGSVGGTIIALITSAILKKEAPEGGME